MVMNSSVKKPPFPLTTKYPSIFNRACYKFYNALDNRLWPVRPYAFIGAATAVGAYCVKVPENALLESLPKFDNFYKELAKIVGVSLFVTYIPIVILRQFLKRFYFSYKRYLFESPRKPSFVTRIWGISCAVIIRVFYIIVLRFYHKILHKTLSFFPPLLKSTDLLLPSPSCPDLEDTIKRYLGSIKNLHTDEELRIIRAQAQDFLTGEGRKLQILARVYSLFTDNYITSFWEKYAYLYNKSSLLINSSVAHVDLFEDRPATAAVRAAHVVWIEAQSHFATDAQRITPLGQGLVCGRHYEKMYAVTRIPDEKCDYLVNYGISRHFVTLCRGNLYKIDICDRNNKIYSIDQLTKIFADILERSKHEEQHFGSICTLTHDKRDSWARNRQKFFLDNVVNKKALEIIESGIFFIVMDDNEGYGFDPQRPEMLSHFMKMMLTGNGTDRWCDKSLNYQINILTSRAGGTTEHSIADGAEFDHIMEDFITMDVEVARYPSLEEQRQIEIITEEDRKSIIFAQKLDVDISEEMHSEINRIFINHKAASDDVDLAATVFQEYGKGLIKSFGVSPDAFVQMAIQLACYRDQGEFKLTYEPASPRFYKNSRTETLRTVCDESCDFVLTFLKDDATREEKIDKLKKATEVHGIRNRECMTGKGIDRHLFVLFVISKAVGFSSPFLENYITQKWFLSTSHVPNVTQQNDEDTDQSVTWIGACFGAVAKNGYGICYRFGGNHSICAHISSFHSAVNSDSHRFQGEFIRALREMAALFENDDSKA